MGMAITREMATVMATVMALVRPLKMATTRFFDGR
jgi:hypothetical protein